ncbi:MAG: hypothetical protein HOL41_19175 [Rhodospirillaceae bacterium]|nr:hypothetical protein [Rhodospirillaceae bacterium]
MERRIEERTRDLVMAREAAEAANQAKTQFLTSMSHELRTPMNAILGFTQLIQRDPMVADNARIERSLKTIHSSGQHLMALIDQVLNLNKLESENDDTMIVALEPLLAIEEGADLLPPPSRSPPDCDRNRFGHPRRRTAVGRYIAIQAGRPQSSFQCSEIQPPGR